MSTIPVPDAQMRAFGLALCKRLGLDPTLVTPPIEGRVEGDMGLVTFTVALPAEEVEAMFNAAGVAVD